MRGAFPNGGASRGFWGPFLGDKREKAPGVGFWPGAAPGAPFSFSPGGFRGFLGVKKGKGALPPVAWGPFPGGGPPAPLDKGAENPKTPKKGGFGPPVRLGAPPPPFPGGEMGRFGVKKFFPIIFNQVA